MGIIDVTSQTFEEEVLKVEGPVIIDFYADWCGPCKMQTPIIEDIAFTNPNIKVVKINVDENQSLAGKYEIMSIPTTMIFKDGEMIKSFVGLTTKQEILDSI